MKRLVLGGAFLIAAAGAANAHHGPPHDLLAWLPDTLSVIGLLAPVLGGVGL